MNAGTNAGLAVVAVLAAMDDEDRDTAVRMIGIMVNALVSPNGAVILLADIEGDGTAAMVAAGNESLVPVLLAAAGSVGGELYGRPDGAALQ